VAVLAVGAAALIGGDDGDRLVPADDPTLPEVSVPEITGPEVTGPGVISPEQTVPDTTGPDPTVPDGVIGVPLVHGLTATSLPGGIVGLRKVDTFGFGDPGRANAVTELTFADGRTLRITLGSLDELRYAVRADDPGLGPDGWQAAEVGDDVATAVGRRETDDTWITVEATRTFDSTTGVWGAALSADEVRSVLVGLRYEPSVDTRPVTDGFVGGGVGAPCEDPTSITGGTARDLVLFTCDGVLAVYDGATGERTEVIDRFDDWANATPDSEASMFAPYVESIAVSPDGRTVWYTVGPEPVSGTLLRYEIGSGAAPVAVAGGYVADLSPDGSLVLVTTPMPSIDLIGADGDGTRGAEQSWNTLGTFVSAGAGAWSPDGRALAVVADGAIGLVEAATGSIALRAPLEGQAYTQAWFGDDGRLYGLLDDGETLRLALVGDLATITSGNAAPVSTEEFGPRGARWVDGLQLEPFGRLLDGDTVVGGGVVAAAVIPG
jgi:hypothetical protein